jgi:hypothetical protein
MVGCVVLRRWLSTSHNRPVGGNRGAGAAEESQIHITYLEL